MMQRYPYLAKYKSSSAYAGIVLFMVEPKRGIVLYVPSVTEGDERYEVNLCDTLLPSNSEIEDYSGSVTFRSTSSPTLGA